jgi:hypothetical protein
MEDVKSMVADEDAVNEETYTRAHPVYPGVLKLAEALPPFEVQIVLAAPAAMIEKLVPDPHAKIRY